MGQLKLCYVHCKGNHNIVLKGSRYVRFRLSYCLCSTVDYVNTNDKCSLYILQFWLFSEMRILAAILVCCFQRCHVIDRQGLARCRRLEVQSVEATTRDTKDESSFVSLYRESELLESSCLSISWRTVLPFDNVANVDNVDNVDKASNIDTIYWNYKGNISPKLRQCQKSLWRTDWHTVQYGPMRC